MATSKKSDRQFLFTNPKNQKEADHPGALYAELAARELARRRLDFFLMRFNERYMMGWMHADICHRLRRCSRMVDERLSPRLMFLTPPRHGKSTIVSKNFPAWHLGHYPHHEYISASYAASLAVSFSREVRMLMREPGYQVLFPNTRLDPENQGVEDWKTTAKGGYIAAGVGGGITGRGAHILSIDDPVKNAEEADSKTTQEGHWDWFGSTAYTRLAPGGAVLLTMTCWNMEDLASKLQNAMEFDPLADQYEIVRYTAEAEEDEWLPRASFEHLEPWAIEMTDSHLLLRRKGDPLHPDRYDLPMLERIKNTLTARHWSALYQQRPIPEEGLLFTKDMFITAAPPDRRYSVPVMAWDFAISEKQAADFTVGVGGWLSYDGMLHVTKVRRMKTSDTFAVVAEILDMAASFEHPSVVAGFEDGHIFKTMRPVLDKAMIERHQFFSYEPLPPLSDKLIRARPLQARMQQRKLAFIDGAPWYDLVFNELTRFPGGGKDDIVDALSWLAQLALRVGVKKIPNFQGPKPTSWKDKIDQMVRNRIGGSFMGA